LGFGEVKQMVLFRIIFELLCFLFQSFLLISGEAFRKYLEMQIISQMLEQLLVHGHRKEECPVYTHKASFYKFGLKNKMA
jgi:hypothetical protein